MKVIVQPPNEETNGWYEADWVEVTTENGQLRIEQYNQDGKLTNWTLIAAGEWSWVRLLEAPTAGAQVRRTKWLAEQRPVANGGILNRSGNYPAL